MYTYSYNYMTYQQINAYIFENRMERMKMDKYEKVGQFLYFVGGGGL